MKVIELLNKIEKGELKPKTRIRFEGKIYVYDYPNLCGIYEENKATARDYNLLSFITGANDLGIEVEIIEDKKVWEPKQRS